MPAAEAPNGEPIEQLALQPRPPSSQVSSMPAISPRTAATSREASSSLMDTLQSRLLHSSQSGKRAELLTKYHLVAELEPWGKRVKDDAQRFLDDQRRRQQEEHQKRERFRLELSRQIEQHEQSNGHLSSRKGSEMQHEREQFLQFRKQEADEKAARREKHLREIDDRKEHLLITSARRERELQQERDEEVERQRLFEKEKREVAEVEAHRRQRQREIAKEMWESNLQIKALKEQQRREEQARDKALVAEYIRITDEERRKRQEFVKSRQRPTTRDIPATNAQRTKDEKTLKFIEAQLKQQEIESQRLERRHEEDQKKKIESQIQTEFYLRQQMDERAHCRQQQRSTDLEERKRLDDDTAAYRRKEHEAKQRKLLRAAHYSDELAQQMGSQRERGLMELIAPMKDR